MSVEGAKIRRRLALRVAGMDCPDCALTIQKNVERMQGVGNVRLDFETGTLEADVLDGVQQSHIEGVVRGLGYEVAGEKSLSFLTRREKMLSTTLSGILALCGMALSFGGAGEGIVIGILLSSMIVGGYRIAQKAFLSARLATFDMNFLMTVAVVGACLIGEWVEAASVVFLFSLAQLLESHAADRARRAIFSLLELAPPSVLVKRNGEEEVVRASMVEVGESVLIKPGERIALDGVVLSGTSHVDQSPITGESLPEQKKEGCRVFAGSLNGEGLLEITTTAPSHNTTLARIIALVERAQARKAPLATFVERFARIYTPSIIGLALLVAVVPPLFSGQWGVWFYRSLVLLVISCPCALVISTPVTVVSGLTKAAWHGVLIKGGLFLEILGKTTVVAFDKTGTLTRGRLSVTDIICASPDESRSVLSWAASAEYGSEHPLAVAITVKAREEGIMVAKPEDFKAHPGLGVVARVREKKIIVGNRTLLARNNISLSFDDEERVLTQDGKIVVCIATEGVHVGIIAVADVLKENAPRVADELRELGAEPMILTGDNERTAWAIAQMAGIRNVRARILPEQKAAEVERLQEMGNVVAMVGDGINDAPALAQADIGIAMGSLGSDIAIETADIALMSDDLSHLPFALRLSRSTLAIVRQNIAASILIKVAFLLLALTGTATLWSAVMADMGASLLVIANGLRLLHK